MTFQESRFLLRGIIFSYCKQEIAIPATLHVKPETGIPIPDETVLSGISLLERARLACNTVNALFPDDADLDEPEEVEVDAARKAFAALTDVDKELPPVDVSKYPTASLKFLDTLLSEYDRELVDSAVRIREYVKNKLLEESQNPDGKIRIRALELLGKMKDVGIFTDRVEVTYKTKSDEELMAELNRKIERFMGPAQLVDAGPEAPLALKPESPEEDLTDFIASLPDGS